MQSLCLIMLLLIMPFKDQALRTVASLMPEILPAATKAAKVLSNSLESNGTFNKVKPKLVKPKSYTSTESSTEMTTAELTECTDESTSDDTTTVEIISTTDSTTLSGERSDEFGIEGKNPPSTNQQAMNTSVESKALSQGGSIPKRRPQVLSTRNLVPIQTSTSSVSESYHSNQVKAYSPAHEYKPSSYSYPDHKQEGQSPNSSAEYDSKQDDPNRVTEAYSYSNSSKNVSVDIAINISIGLASENSTSRPRLPNRKRLASQQEVVAGLFLMVVISLTAVGALIYVAIPTRRRYACRRGRGDSDLVELLAGPTSTKYRPVRKYYDATMYM